MTENDEKIQIMLALLRKDFLIALADKCFQIEVLILQFAGIDRHSPLFDEVYRLIHSLKGAGGTHGLPIVSSICHYFEDQMVSVEGHFDEKFITHALSLLDLLQQVVADGQEGSVKALDDIYINFAILQKSQKADQVAIMVLESSKMMRLMLTQLLAQFDVKITMMQDGILALQRLIHEQFDLIIVSIELSNLKGPALISALQLNQGLNAQTPVIMLTSKSDFDTQHLANITLLPRSPELANLLEPVIHRYSQKRCG